MGRLHFIAESYGWLLFGLAVGALGMCIIALGGCDGAAAAADPPVADESQAICLNCTDPSRIAYVLDYSIHVMHGDGTGDVDLQTEGRHPALSHDRTRIAYVANDAKIWTMALDGSSKKQITAGSTVEDYPSFSPDDAKLVFMSAAWEAAGYGNEVYVASSAPAAPTSVGQWKKLTSSGGDWLYSPKFTADGGRVGFQLGIYQDYDVTTARIALVDSTLSNQTKQYWQFLTTPTYGAGYVKTSDGSPDFSGDGTRIAYTEYDDTGSHIWRMAVNGSNKTQLTSGSHDDGFPDWATGAGMVFTSDRAFTICGAYFCFTYNQNHTARNLYAMDANGGSLRRLTSTTTSQVLDPSWQ